MTGDAPRARDIFIESETSGYEAGTRLFRKALILWEKYDTAARRKSNKLWVSALLESTMN